MLRLFLHLHMTFAALLLVCTLFLAGNGANAADLPGESCTSLGVSTMASDHQNLIACLQGKDGKLIWKAMTEQKGASIPVGAIIAWPVATNPDDMQNEDGGFNWLDCNGQNIPASLYPELYKKIGAHAPDLRGLFLRGYGSQAYAQNNGTIIGKTNTLHASGVLGTIQGDSIRNLVGDIQGSDDLQPSGIFANLGAIGNANGGPAPEWYARFDAARVTPTANEIRPVNMAVRYLIRARP